MKENEIDKILEQADLSESISKAVKIKGKGRPKIGRKVNITLSEDLIEKLTKAGEKKGLGYQTMARLILNEQIEGYIDDVS